jgi:ribosomal protein L40E
MWSLISGGCKTSFQNFRTDGPPHHYCHNQQSPVLWVLGGSFSWGKAADPLCWLLLSMSCLELYFALYACMVWTDTTISTCIWTKLNISKINRWLGNQHQRRWWNIDDSQRQARELISGSCQGTRIRLLSLTRVQSRVVTGLLTGHNTLHRHLLLMRLVDSPLCRMCGAEDETSAHICCQCEGLASIRHAYLGFPFSELGDIKQSNPGGHLAL